MQRTPACLNMSAAPLLALSIYMKLDSKSKSRVIVCAITVAVHNVYTTREREKKSGAHTRHYNLLRGAQAGFVPPRVHECVGVEGGMGVCV